MKRVLTVILIILFSIFFSFAQENVNQEDIQCGGVSEYIDDWENIVNKALFGLDLGSKEFGFEEYPSFYENFKDKIKSKIGDITNKVGGYTVGVLWSAMTLLGENVTSPFAVLVVLFRPEEVVNDYKQLMFLENKIRDFMLQAGKSGRFFDKVDKKKIEKINKLLENGLVKFKIKEGINYGDLGSLLYMFNFVYKNVVLYASWTSNDKKVSRYLKSICEGKNVGSYCNYIENKINLDTTKYLKLKKRYSKCQFKGFDQMLERLNNLVETFSSDVSKTLNRFPKALEKLDEALEGFKKDIKDKALTGDDGWINFRSNIRFSDLSKKVADIKDKITKGFSDFEVKKEEVFKLPNSDIDKIKENYLQDFGIFKKDILKKQLLTSFDFVENLQRQLLLDNASTEVMVTTLTRKYVFLSRAIHYNILLIGGKDSEDSIIYLLGDACDKQCSNVGGICWYF